MKTKIYFLLLFIITSKVFPQITITQADFGGVGTTIIQAQDTISTNIYPGNAGANQNWDFSSMQANTTNTISFINPSALPCDSLFPSANIAQPANGGYNFFNLSSNGFDLVGSCDTSLSQFQLYGFVRLISFPSTFNTSFVNSYRYSIKNIFNSPPNDSFLYIRTFKDSSLIDAWGKITTPLGGPFDCLREKVTRQSIDSIFVHDSTTGQWNFVWVQSSNLTDYHWFSNNGKWILVEISTDTFGNVTNKSFLVSATTTGINDMVFQNDEVLIYPNPFSTSATIKINSEIKKGKFILHDVLGREIKQIEIDGNSIEIKRENLPNGIYFYKITNEKNEIIASGKIVTQ